MTYGAGSIRRARATKAEMQVRREALYEIVRAAQPTGVRFTYYRAVALGIVPKTEAGYRQVQRLLADMRESGELPYEWITDATRLVRRPVSYDGIDDALRALGSSYRRSLWTDAQVLVEVWVESKSAAGVIAPVTYEWDVPLYPISGQTSMSFAHTAAMQYRREPRDVVVYYVGDLDPAGMEIELHLREKLRRYSGRHVTFARVACTQAQVITYRLMGTTPKKNCYYDPIADERVPWHGDAVEVEAIDPPVLRELVEDAILQHINPDALDVLRMVEDQERAGLEALARVWSA